MHTELPDVQTFNNVLSKNCFFCLQALAVMEVAHGKDHQYVAEVKREIEEQN